MPPTDFVDLAARMSAGLAGVRACLILSRDGLSLGAHPADGEGKARAAWDALERIGDPKRGFIDMGTEMWVVARGEEYAAVMVATPEAKPGLLLDCMTAELATVERGRNAPCPEAEQTSEPARTPEPVLTAAKVVDLSVGSAPTAPAVAPPVMPEAPPPSPAAPPARAEETPVRRDERIDRVALAREFGRLFENRNGDA